MNNENIKLRNKRILSYLLKLPKAELHVHMEGFIYPFFLNRLAKKNKIKLPFKNEDQQNDLYKYKSFKDFSSTLLLGVHCLKEPEDFYDLILEIGKNMYRQNIRYAEVTWTPQFYLNLNCSLNSILAAMSVAKEKLITDYNVKLNWIPDIVRSYPQYKNQITDWVISNKSKGIVAMGLAGPEHNFPSHDFKEVFERARINGVPSNPHSGEGTSPQSVWDTLEALKPLRIGHGVSASTDPKLIDHLTRHQIVLEICPTSNIKLGLYKSYQLHPIKFLKEAGCNITINTDDPALFQTTLTNEYYLCHTKCGLSLEDIKFSILQSIQFSYLDEQDKDIFKKECVLEFKRLDNIYSDLFKSQ
jgi:adenosine deaminase